MTHRHPVIPPVLTPREKRWILVRRVPQLTGEPEFVVARDTMPAEAIAHFFKVEDARWYIEALQADEKKVKSPVDKLRDRE